jgi:dephospho-CoA kinase
MLGLGTGSLHVFGLTGGIGTGKSTVAARFRARGLPVIDADQLAREAVAPGSAALPEIAALFGANVIGRDGTLDRAKLAAKVFDDPAQRSKLNAIVHPRVRALAEARFSELERRGEPLGCYEVPLLFEVGLEQVLRPVVVVSSSQALQLARATKRDASTAEHVAARIRAQLPLAEKRRRADYVIDNDGDLPTLIASADEVLDRICAQFRIDARRYPR